MPTPCQHLGVEVCLRFDSTSHAIDASARWRLLDGVDARLTVRRPPQDKACVIANLNAEPTEIEQQVKGQSLFFEGGLMEGVPHDDGSTPKNCYPTSSELY